MVRARQRPACAIGAGLLDSRGTQGCVATASQFGFATLHADAAVLLRMLKSE